MDGFYATSIVMLALLAAGFAISSALRPHGEEDGGRLEALLATALPRSRWLLGHVAVTVVGHARSSSRPPGSDSGRATPWSPATAGPCSGSRCRC